MYVKVRVVTSAKIEKLERKSLDSFRLEVRAPAERGLANERVLEMMRHAFPDAKIIRIVSGHTSPSKIVSVD